MVGIYIKANRNSALTTEKNDILKFLGSYFLSISWSCMNFRIQKYNGLSDGV